MRTAIVVASLSPSSALCTIINLQAGVEYSVLRASITAAAANAFLTALALWIPLLPMLWLLRRVIDQRQGAG